MPIWLNCLPNIRKTLSSPFKRNVHHYSDHTGVAEGDTVLLVGSKKTGTSARSLTERKAVGLEHFESPLKKPTTSQSDDDAISGKTNDDSVVINDLPPESSGAAPEVLSVEPQNWAKVYGNNDPTQRLPYYDNAGYIDSTPDVTLGSAFVFLSNATSHAPAEPGEVTIVTDDEPTNSGNEKHVSSLSVRLDEFEGSERDSFSNTYLMNHTFVSKFGDIGDNWKC